MAFIDRLLPALVGGSSAMKGYWIWGGSVIPGDDGRYHMFASRWPHELPFFEGHQTHSEVVRAVAEVEDPYVWWSGDHLGLLAKDMTSGLSSERHAGVHATSCDAIHWTLSQLPMAYSRRML